MRVALSSTPSLMPTLSPGRHRNPKKGACFMEFASFLAGERWSDHPACTHPLLAALARDVNDLSSDAARAQLMPLVNRVIGLASDDPRVWTAISVRAAVAALPVASFDRQRALAVGILNALDGSVEHDVQLTELAESALAQAPDAARWARRYIDSMLLSREFGPQAAVTMVHTASVGIALACVLDSDRRLAEVLEFAIEDLEALLSHREPSGDVAVAVERDELQLA